MELDLYENGLDVEEEGVGDDGNIVRDERGWNHGFVEKPGYKGV